MDASNALQVAGRYFYFTYIPYQYTSDGQITAQITTDLINGAAPNFRPTLQYELGGRGGNLAEIQQLAPNLRKWRESAEITNKNPKYVRVRSSLLYRNVTLLSNNAGLRRSAAKAMLGSIDKFLFSFLIISFINAIQWEVRTVLGQ